MMSDLKGQLLEWSREGGGSLEWSREGGGSLEWSRVGGGSVLTTFGFHVDV